MLSIVDFGAAARLYKMLSYGSVALLFLVMLWQAPASVTLGRLGLLSLYGVDVSAFTANLVARAAHDIGIPITFRLNLETLYALRSRLTSGGASAANWVLLAGIAGWIFSGITVLLHLFFRRSLRVCVLADVLVLAMVSVGVFVWYRCFTAHTYIHAPFMVRLLPIVP